MPPAEHSAAVAIRPFRPSDLTAVLRIAERDGLPLPPGELLVAEVGGEPRAAVSRDTGEAVADPFRHTDHLVELLHLRAGQLSGGSVNGRTTPAHTRDWRLPALRWARR